VPAANGSTILHFYCTRDSSRCNLQARICIVQAHSKWYVSEQRRVSWSFAVLWLTWHENSPLYSTVLLVVIINCFAYGWSVWSLAKLNIVNCFRTERPSTEITTLQLTSESTSLPSTPAATTTATGNLHFYCTRESSRCNLQARICILQALSKWYVSEQPSVSWSAAVLWLTWHVNCPLYCIVLLVVTINCFACGWSVWSLAKRNIVNCFRTERPLTEITTSQLTSESASLPSTPAATTTPTGNYISIVLANPVGVINKPGYVFFKRFLNGMFLNNLAWVDQLRYFD